MVVKLLGTKRAKQLRLLLITCAIFIIAMVIYFPNYAKLKKLKKENVRLFLENVTLEKEIADYEEKLSRVGDDPYIYEKIAREELGVAKDNEIVIDIE
jgi:cell division protein FtsB